MFKKLGHELSTNKNKINFILLCFLLCFFPFYGKSQQGTSVIKGNIGVKNVNISIISTNFGVSSNDKGDFIMMLPKTGKQVGLLFTCIGYEDTLLSVIPNRDTIEINFRMQEAYYMLDAVGVSADKIKRYSEPSYVMFDFEIYDDKVFILQRKDNTLKECRILINDLWLDPIDTIVIPNHIEPEKIIVDCTESCQLLGIDSVYQVAKMNSSYKLMFPVEKERYNKVLKNIIFFTDKYIYFNELLMDGYISNFFRIGKESKEKEMMFVSNDLKTYRDVAMEKQWYIAHPQGSGPSVEDWERFVKMAWFHTKDCYLTTINDTLYYFDHLNCKIQMFNEEMNTLHECVITYPTKEDFWRHKIYKDNVFGEFYTIFGSNLNKIDVKTGKTTVITTVNSMIAKKIIIHKGYLFVIINRRNAIKEFRTYIERIEL